MAICIRIWSFVFLKRITLALEADSRPLLHVRTVLRRGRGIKKRLTWLAGLGLDAVPRKVRVAVPVGCTTRGEAACLHG